MFNSNHKNLRLSFNKFHDVVKNDMPKYGEFCLLELKDGGYTGGEWCPDRNAEEKETVSGQFIRGTADSIPAEEVAKWHSLDRDDISRCLEDEEVNWINLGVEGDDIYSVVFKDFKSTRDGEYPKDDQYCLLIMMDGGLGAGRWEEWSGEDKGAFIYAPALAMHTVEKVWAWTALSPDRISIEKEEEENERIREEELNRNPSTDPEKFKYGTDIEVYYEKALEKLRVEYPWATVTQMKKNGKWVITPVHGQYVFGLDNGTIMGIRQIREWKDGNTADEFIDYLCGYAKSSVKDSDPDKKFKLGMDIDVYLERAFENVKKDYRWIDKKTIAKSCRYLIKQVDGDWEFVRDYGKDGGEYVCNCSSAEEFIKDVERDYQNAALRSNIVVDVYKVPFGRIDIHGWGLERYEFSKMKSGDYKVDVQAGDRVTGGSREFFITPYCFEAKTYEEFLDRYLDIVPGGSFGLYKEDFLPNKELQRFLGY